MLKYLMLFMYFFSEFLNINYRGHGAGWLIIIITKKNYSFNVIFEVEVFYIFQ